MYEYLWIAIKMHVICFIFIQLYPKVISERKLFCSETELFRNLKSLRRHSRGAEGLLCKNMNLAYVGREKCKSAGTALSA